MHSGMRVRLNRALAALLPGLSAACGKAAQVTLTVALSGPGHGTIRSSPAGIDCPAVSCAAKFDAGSAVQLSATPDDNSLVGSWSATGCSGASCAVTISTAANVTIDFTLRQFTLTVTKRSVGGGMGDVTGGGIDCGATCSTSVLAGTTVTLTTVAPTFQSFGVDCSAKGCTWVTAHSVDVLMHADHTVEATFRGLINYVFTTEAGYSGNLGGLAGADGICAAHAAGAGLTGMFVAWLSTSTVSAVSRLGSARGWMRTDGRLFADSTPAMLGSRQTFYPPILNASGVDVSKTGALFPPLSNAWTGTYQDGTAKGNATQRCGDWISTSGNGFVGMPARWFAWNDANTVWPCNAASGAIYCFETTYSAAVAPPPVPSGGRLAFLSSPFPSGGGVAAADAVCASDAATAGLQRTFRALLAGVGKPPFDPARFDSSHGPWYRLDGVQLVANATDFAATGAPKLLAPTTVTANGQYALPGGLAWVGYGGNNDDLTTPGTAATTCNGWTSSSSSDSAVVGLWDSVAYNRWGALGCDQSERVQCLEP